MVELTVHAYERCKERSIGHGETIYNNVQKAYDRGRLPDDFNKEAKKYLSNLLKGSKGNSVRVYGNFVYIFFNNILITMFPFNQKIIKKNMRHCHG